MATSVFVLLALIGHTIGIFPIPAGSEARAYPNPTLMVASPRGRTGAEMLCLRGPVREVLEEYSVPEKTTAPTASRRFAQRVQFDTHGNVTALTIAHPAAKDTASPDSISFSNTHRYDAQGRVQQSTVTLQQSGPEPLTFDVQRSYDARGCLTEVNAVLPEEGKSQATLKFTSTFDADGRINQQRMLGGANAPPALLMQWRYRYEGDGRTITEIVSLPDTGISHRLWFDTRGLLTEWQSYDAKGKVQGKTFLRYNAHGDLLRYSSNELGYWIKYEYDSYSYDEYDNWTARTRYHIREKDGKDVRDEQGITQYRTLTYDTQTSTT